MFSRWTIRRGTTRDLAVTPRQPSRRPHLEPSNCFSAPLGLSPCCGGVACAPHWTHELRRLGFFPWWVQPCRIGRRGEARQRIAPSVPNQRLGHGVTHPSSWEFSILFSSSLWRAGSPLISQAHFSIAPAFVYHPLSIWRRFQSGALECFENSFFFFLVKPFGDWTKHIGTVFRR